MDLDKFLLIFFVVFSLCSSLWQFPTDIIDTCFSKYFFFLSDFEQSLGHQPVSEMFSDLPPNELPNIPKKPKRKKSKSSSSPSSASSSSRGFRLTKSKATPNNMEATPNLQLLQKYWFKFWQLIRILEKWSCVQQRFLKTSTRARMKVFKLEHNLCPSWKSWRCRQNYVVEAREI